MWVALSLASLPGLIDPGAVSRGAALLGVAGSAHPYLPGQHPLLLGVWIPLVVLSSLVLVLAPGLVASFALGRPRGAAVWLFTGLAASVVLLSPFVEAAEALTGGPIRGSGLGLLGLGLAGALALIGVPGGRVERPWATRSDRHTLAAAAVAVLVCFVLLLPKFLWETFNGDGAHAFESARLLLHQAVPFWRPEAGGMANYPGITTFLSSYPTSWLVRLFGESEAAARIPYLLFLGAGLFPGLLALIDEGRADRERSVSACWLVWVGLAVYTVVMAFSATYNPYHADIALPATEDTLAIAWFLGLAWATVAGRAGWVGVFTVLAYVTSPMGLILIGLWLAAALLFLRPVPLRGVATMVVVLGASVVAARVAPALLTAAGWPVPGQEHATGSLARRVLRGQWRDWHRLIYVIVPAGILPAFSVLLVTRQDRIARAVAAVAAAEFVFFYFQARVSLHYFAPAMVLPLIVFWRTVPSLWRGPGLRLAVAAAGAIALYASLPSRTEPHLAARMVGSGIEDRIEGYDRSESAAFGRSSLLSELLPRDSHGSVPEKSYGGSPLSWFYYAHHPAEPRAIGYVFQSAALPAPPGARLAGTSAGVALYVVDEAILTRDRGLRPPVTIARIYRISKHTLFIG